jgi:HD-GYP domain-containing protein (c-di-GMP phosphodiesterase class II)
MDKLCLSVNALKKGMYVSQLDCDWTETDFLFQGLMIETEEQIEELAKYCSHVYINTDLTLNNVDLSNIADPPKPKPVLFRPSPDVTMSVQQALPAAKLCLNEADNLVENILNDIQNKKDIQLHQVEEVVCKMTESISNNPDAMILLCNMRDSNKGLFEHAIQVSTFMITFGRHLGLPKTDLIMLGMCGLLQDVGKIKLPESLVNTTEALTDEQHKEMKKHVDYSVDMLSGLPGISSELLKVISQHHERYDGSGYPLGISGDNITIKATIAGIIDSYVAMTNQRRYSTTVSNYHALQHLMDNTDKLYKGVFVEQLVECIGIYTPGSLVELSTGEVAIVVEKNRKLKLKPKVLIILNEDKKPYPITKTLDLALIPSVIDGDNLRIARVLEPNSYDIDPKEFFIL